MSLQTYHLEPPCGLMNDPNGLSFYHGRYRVFFQWNRFAKDHTHKEWGAFSSADLAHWSFDGSAIVPDQPYDHSGVHSGCAIEMDGELLLYYTGSDKSCGVRRSHQCLVSTTDCHTYLKEGVVIETPEGFTGHVRDPKVITTSKGLYCMLLGAQRTNGKAALIAFDSSDGRSWRFAGTFAASEAVEMCECPDLVSLPEGRMLLWCPQRRDNERDLGLESYACYREVTEGELASGTLSLDSGIQTEPGSDFYAPQTFVAPDARTILIAWMDRLGDEQGRALAAASHVSGCLTVPRELSLRAGRLCQVPVSELVSLERTRYALVTCGDGSLACHPDTRAFRIRIRKVPDCTLLHVELNGGSETLSFDTRTDILTLSRTDWMSGKRQEVSRNVGRLRNLDLLSDSTSLELFANDGEAVITMRVLPQTKDASVRITGVTDPDLFEVVEMGQR